tara:strand:+ start:568 stop:1125 length:558 start_codon:yes stop_codon:yes gene_type:complete
MPEDNKDDFDGNFVDDNITGIDYVEDDVYNMADDQLTEVFVYGTLKSGGEIRGLDTFNKAKQTSMVEGWPPPIANIVGKAKTVHPDFTMIDLGSFPGVVLITTDGIPHAYVQGEVWQVNKTVLNELDMIEGHPDFYERKKTETTQGIAWMYVLPESYIKMYKGAEDESSQVSYQDQTYIWNTIKA